METLVIEKEKLPGTKRNDLLTHEAGEDDFVDIDKSFNMIKDTVISIYRENGDL